MKEDLLKIVEHFGINNQQRKLEEEVFELQEAIINAENNRMIGICREPSELAIKHIAEEIADCLVMIYQFVEYYNIDQVELCKIMDFKINRQLERINKER